MSEGEEQTADAEASGSIATETEDEFVQSFANEGGQHVYAIFNDRVEFKGKTGFGFAKEARLGRITGPLLDADVDRVLQHYVKPAGFSRARACIAKQRVVLLHGQEGIGKRAGALMLLDDAGVERPIVALSPALQLDEIVKHKFRTGRGYLLQDWLGDPGRSESLAFAMQTLRAELDARGAHLIITMGKDPRNSALRGIAVHWDSPDPAEVVDEYLREVEISEELRAQVHSHFAGCPSPRQIAEIAERLEEDGSDISGIGALLESGRHDEVAACFDNEHTADWAVLVTALVFAYDVPVPTFERALLDLESELWPEPEPEPKESDEDEEPPAVRPRVLKPTRADLAQNPLVKLRGVGGDRFAMPGGPRLIFTSDGHRARVLEELWARYDHRLWDPVESWLDTLVLVADDELQLSVALGLAIFFRTAPDATRERYLDRWAAGTHGHGLVAAYAMWWLALDDATAANALSIATEWAQDSNRRRRTTAILALSGSLGARFPGDALRWLWHLARGNDRLATLAQIAIGDLARACGAANEPDTSVLSFLANKLRKARRDRSISAAEGLVLQVFHRVVTVKDDRELAIVGLLSRSAPAVGLLGPLWAESLINRPFRGASIEALGKTLRALHRAQRKDVIAGLGRAIVGALPAHEVAVLERDLFSELDVGDRSARDAARTIVEVMLTPPTALPIETDESEAS